METGSLLITQLMTDLYTHTCRQYNNTCTTFVRDERGLHRSLCNSQLVVPCAAKADCARTNELPDIRFRSPANNRVHNIAINTHCHEQAAEFRPTPTETAVDSPVWPEFHSEDAAPDTRAVGRRPAGMSLPAPEHDHTSS